MFDNRHSQPLVDAAFLVQGLLRAPNNFGEPDVDIQKKLVYELKRTRGIKPNESNWLLFASMVEAALLEFTGEYDSQRLYYGVNRFIDEWYKGDAWYGDGAELHLDYYNSLVIHPMMTDVLSVMKKHRLERAEFLERQLVRQQRMAAQLETDDLSGSHLSCSGPFYRVSFWRFSCAFSNCFVGQDSSASFQRTDPFCSDSCYAEADIYARYF